MTAAAHAPTTGPYVAALTTYTKAKWKGVLPLPAGAKWAPPEGHTGHGNPDPDGPTLVAWRNHPRHQHANIALRLPQGVVGIDVDDYGSKKGAQELAQLEELYGPLPDTWTSTSRGPGPSRIAFYRCSEGLVLPGKLAPAIEAIQRHHRYAVVWPSVVEGRLYRWYAPDGTPMDRPPKLDELAWLPDGWHNIQKPARPTPDAHYTPRAVDGDWSKAVTRYHGEGVQGLALPGGRHDSMLPVVMTLVRLDHDGHPGAAEALDDLRSRFVAAVSDRSGPVEALKEWDRMEAGAEAQVAVTPSLRGSYEDLRADYRERQRPEPPKQQPQPEASEASQEDGDELTPSRLRANLHLGSAILDLPPVEWLIDRVVQDKGLSVVYGPPKSFKTFVVLDMALHIANGMPWRGLEVRRTNVLYVVAEGAPGVGPRGQAWCSRFGGSLDRMAWITVAPDLFYMSGDPTEVADIAVELGCGLVIVDTLARSMAGADENSAKDMGLVVANLDIIKERAGAAVMAVHHTGKDSTRGMRGSNSLQGAVDTSIEVIGDRHTVNARVADQKNAESDMAWWWKPALEAPSMVLDPTEGLQSSGEVRRVNVLRQLQLIDATGGGVTANKWGEACTDNDICRSSKFEEIKKELADDGHVVNSGTRQRARWQITPKGLELLSSAVT